MSISDLCYRGIRFILVGLAGIRDVENVMQLVQVLRSWRKALR